MIKACILRKVKEGIAVYPMFQKKGPYIYMNSDHSDRRPQGSARYAYAPSIPPLIVMGEDKQKIEETPHGYSIEQGNSSLVTIGMVRRMASSGHDVLLASHPWLKDLCLSFALFKLLTRRFAKIHLAECGSAKAFSFVLDVLLNNGSADRVFSCMIPTIHPCRLHTLGGCCRFSIWPCPSQ